MCSLRLTEGKDSNQQLTMVPIRKSESQTRSSLCSCGNERYTAFRLLSTIRKHRKASAIRAGAAAGEMKNPDQEASTRSTATRMVSVLEV